MLLPCFSIAIQFYTGVICLSALLKTRRKSRSNSANFLLCHMLALELANIIGLVTALIGFMWCLGPLRPFSQPPREGDSDGWQLFDEALQKFLGRWKQLGYSSNASFVVSGFLTDGVLVSSASSFIHSLLIIWLLTRSGGVDKLRRLPSIQDRTF